MVTTMLNAIPALTTAMRDRSIRGHPREVYLWLHERLDVVEYRVVKHAAIERDLALFVQKIAIAVLGFLAGGKLATWIAAAFFVHYAQYSTIIFVVGGIIGAILLLAVFGWALIVVSSFIGAYLIQSAIVLPPTGPTLVFIGLAIVGMFAQAASFRRSAA